MLVDKAVEDEFPCLSTQLLEQVWKEIREKRVTDFSHEDNDEGDEA